jgi:RNA polymerase sigma-70 factor (ECF subfamily)
MPFRLWLRKTAQERLLKIERQHLATGRRAVGREVSLPEPTSCMLGQQLLASGPTPSERLGKSEIARRVRQAVAQLPEADQEILLLRNFEEVSNQEAAFLLDLDPTVASKRYGRALLRLRQVLLEGGFSESQQ